MAAPKIRRIDSQDFSLDPIREAAQLIRIGGAVVFPTTGLYGLGTDALRHDAVERVYRIKQRPADKPLSVLVRNRDCLESLVQGVSPAAQRLMDRFWPGGITLLFAASDSLPANLTAGTGKIGVRSPAHPVAVALLNELDAPLTATSANIAGEGGCSRIVDLDPRVRSKADLILDSGPLLGGAGSTVVDTTVEPAAILRKGAVSAADVMAAVDNHH